MFWVHLRQYLILNGRSSPCEVRVQKKVDQEEDEDKSGTKVQTMSSVQASHHHGLCASPRFTDHQQTVKKHRKVKLKQPCIILFKHEEIRKQVSIILFIAKQVTSK